MEIERLYTTGDIARLFRVTPTTVRRWARQGRLGDTEIRTPGNQRRFRAEYVDKLLLEQIPEEQDRAFHDMVALSEELGLYDRA